MFNERHGGPLVVRVEDNSDDLRVFRYVENVDEGHRLASAEMQRNRTRRLRSAVRQFVHEVRVIPAGTVATCFHQLTPVALFSVDEKEMICKVSQPYPRS
jgi:hypothetical protein